MGKQYFKFYQIFTLLLLTLLVGCGSLNSFTRLQKPLVLTPGMSVFISSMDCNLQKCTSKKNLLHKRLKATLLDIFNVKGIRVVEDKEVSDFEFLLVTAHEEDIEYSLPRNVHLIVRNSADEELLQIGISENFSSPITNEYIQISLVAEKLRSKLNPHLTNGLYTKLSKN